MKTAFSTVVLALFVAACADGGDGGSGGAVGTDRAEITGGKLVPASAHGAPDTSVVKLQVTRANGKTLCTGIKVAANTFWTAGSCIEGAVVGNEVRVTNSLDGDLNSSAAYVTTVSSPVDVHPSRKNFVNHAAPGPKHYDVGRLTLAADTPSIPAYSTTHPDWMAPNQTVTYTAYGADANSLNDEKKQYAHFPLTSAAAYATATGQSLSQINPIYVHSMLSGPGIPSSSFGDDGAPVFQKFGTIWKIVGIVPEDTADTAFVRFGNVKRWLESPAVNHFVPGFSGFIFNKHTGRCLLAEPGPAGFGFVSETDCDGRAQGNDRQSWGLLPLGSGFFQIVNGGLGSCLQATTRLDVAPCGAPATMSQSFTFGSASHPDYRTLQNGAATGCALPQLPNGTSGGPVIVWPCSPSDDRQSWVMTR